MTVAVESNASKSNCCCASKSYGYSNHVTSNKEKTSEESHNATSICASSQQNFDVLVLSCRSKIFVKIIIQLVRY